MSLDPLLAEDYTIIIHALSALATLPMAAVHARNHNTAGHKKFMTGLFVGGLIIAGRFTLLPGRIMNAVVFGAPSPSTPLVPDSD